jgi:hypothetical protein
MALAAQPHHPQGGGHGAGPGREYRAHEQNLGMAPGFVANFRVETM